MRVLLNSAMHRVLPFCAKAGLMLIVAMSSAYALPQGGVITQGEGRIARTETSIDIYQRSNFLATKWQSFDIATNENVRAHQAHQDMRLVIRVDGASGTNIAGSLSARGSVILENPLGIQFSAGSVVNVGGLLAVAAKGSVINHGDIRAGQAGVRLSGARVENNGRVIATGGDIHFGAGADDAYQAKLVSIGGVVEAKRLARKGGAIVLEGGETTRVKKNAKLKAPVILVGGAFQGEGNIKTAAYTIVESEAKLDAGAHGRVIVWSDKTTWFHGRIKADFAEVSGKAHLAAVNLVGIQANDLLLDPAVINIGTATTDNGQISDGEVLASDGGSGTYNISASGIAAHAGNLTLAATGNINVNHALSKSASGGLILRAGGNINIGHNINMGENVLTLIAGHGSSTGAINFSSTGTTTLTGGTVTLTADKTSDAIKKTAGSLTVEAISGSLSITGDIKAASGTVTLKAVRAVNIYSPIAIGAASLIIEATRHNNTAGIINFHTHPLTMSAHNITVKANQVVSDSLTLQAANDLTITSNINAGKRLLRLEAGFGRSTGTLNFDSNKALTLRAGNIVLKGKETAVTENGVTRVTKAAIIKNRGDLIIGEATYINVEITGALQIRPRQFVDDFYRACFALWRHHKHRRCHD